MPGYGFSGKPTASGWNPVRITRAWDTLMKRLGYSHYVAQGGDWGAKVSEALARQAPEGLLGIHINLLLNIPSRNRAVDRRRRPATRWNAFAEQLVGKPAPLPLKRSCSG
jgi:pimeloyl-ACP methyl ester carboxylesterase